MLVCLSQKQIAKVDIEAASDALKRVNGRVCIAVFDVEEVRVVHAHHESELAKRKALAGSEMVDSVSDLLAIAF